MARRKRGYIPGAEYYSEKYRRMRNQRISDSMTAYWFRRKAHEAYSKGTATPEQMALVRREHRFLLIFGLIVLAGMGIGMWIAL